MTSCSWLIQLSEADTQNLESSSPSGHSSPFVWPIWFCWKLASLFSCESVYLHSASLTVKMLCFCRSRLQSEVKLLKQQLSDSQHLLHSLRLELQVFEKMKTDVPKSHGTKVSLFFCVLMCPRCKSIFSLDIIVHISRVQRGSSESCSLWLVGSQRAAFGDPTPEAAAGKEHPDQHGPARKTGGAAA